MKLLLFICGLVVQGMLYACSGTNQPAYSGKVEYSIDPANPFSCTATITLDFDINESLANDSMTINWGDGNESIVHASSITLDSAASAGTGGINIYKHVYIGSYVYDTVPASGYYFISFQNVYRINGIANIAGGLSNSEEIYLWAQVSIDTATGGQYQPLAFPPLTMGFANLTSFAENGLQQTSDGTDSISYSFTTPLVPSEDLADGPTAAPQYQLPGQFCLANGSSNSSFTIDAGTGNISWTNPCLQGVYSFATMLSKYRNGQLISAITREQDIYVQDNGTGIKNIADAANLEIYPNPAVNTLSGIITAPNVSPEFTLEIIAPDGRIVASNIVVKDGVFETDISRLSSGIYFLHVQNGDDVQVKRFIKQ